MAMITCSECSAQISDKAASCPSCGNPLTAAAAVHKPVPVQIVKPKSNMIWWVLGTPVALFGLVMAIGSANNGPDAQARARQRDAIDLCWKEQGKKSMDPSTGRFVAGFCEQMQADLDAGRVKGAVPSAPYVPTAYDISQQKKEAADTVVETRVCKSKNAELVTEFQRLMAAGEYWPAAVSIRRCAQLTDDPKLTALVADAEIKSYVKDIDDPKTPKADRVRFIEALSRDYPEQGKKYDSLLKKFR